MTEIFILRILLKFISLYIYCEYQLFLYKYLKNNIAYATEARINNKQLME